MKMREFVIGYSKEKAKFRRQEIDKLEREITLLEHQLLSAPSKSIVDEIDNKKSKLNKIYDYFRQGLRIRL